MEEDHGADHAALTPAQQAQVERNRQRALLIRQARSMAHPYTREAVQGSIVRIQGSKLVDTGGGFLISESDLQEDSQKVKLTSEPAPIIKPDRPKCDECQEEFAMSFLLTSFDFQVCDKCRDNEDKHRLITKTEAKKEYLLQDHDFDKREPPLKFLLRKNPHDSRWGDMKLYLRAQVEERAEEVWGSMDELDKKKEEREEKREVAKVKKHTKQVKALRMAMRSSLYTRDVMAHEHTYGEETYDEEEDMYRKECTECGHVQTYEKM